MSKTERHLIAALAELASAHLAALTEHDRETANAVGLLESAASNSLELLKRKREAPRMHPG